MSKIITICGKIGCGKTHYCQQLLRNGNTVLLSCDEILSDLFHQDTGDRHDKILGDIKRYLHKKAVEIAHAGCDVILDWGFWSRRERSEVAAYYRSRGVACEWHYIDISDQDWHDNIRARNRSVASGASTDYFIDEGLLEKLGAQFEAPDQGEIDCWHRFERD